MAAACWGAGGSLGKEKEGLGAAEEEGGRGESGTRSGSCSLSGLMRVAAEGDDEEGKREERNGSSGLGLGGVLVGMWEMKDGLGRPGGRPKWPAV